MTAASVHCTDLAGDRKIGELLERKFCAMAGSFGKAFTPHQIGRTMSAQAAQKSGREWRLWTLPDVTVWTFPGEHHEIKHKYATRAGLFGLEKYRFDALLWFADKTQQSVLYTIHDYEQQPDATMTARKRNVTNVRGHWLTCDVLKLKDCIRFTSKGDSYVNGVAKPVDIHYWHRSSFMPLIEYWMARMPAGSTQ